MSNSRREKLACGLSADRGDADAGEHDQGVRPVGQEVSEDPAQEAPLQADLGLFLPPVRPPDAVPHQGALSVPGSAAGQTIQVGEVD